MQIRKGKNFHHNLSITRHDVSAPPTTIVHILCIVSLGGWGLLTRKNCYKYVTTFCRSNHLHVTFASSAGSSSCFCSQDYTTYVILSEHPNVQGNTMVNGYKTSTLVPGQLNDVLARFLKVEVPENARFDIPALSFMICLRKKRTGSTLEMLNLIPNL